MIAGDVRTLARDYCAKGTTVYYEHYDALSHITSIGVWAAELDRLDRGALRRRAGAAELLVDPAGHSLDPIPVPYSGFAVNADRRKMAP